MVTYTPSDVGTYTVGVKFGGQSVPSSPFHVTTSPTGDASKVKILGRYCGLFFVISAMNIKLVLVSDSWHEGNNVPSTRRSGGRSSQDETRVVISSSIFPLAL